MSTVASPKVFVQTCDNGRLIRTWYEDGQTNVQLTTPNGVELSRARFDGWQAADMAELVANTWWDANR